MRNEFMTERDGPLISVIVAVYNGAETIERLLLSVANCAYPHIDLIIMDGGSSDGTLEVLKKYETYIKCWRSEKDNGIYDALNKAISLCEVGSYVLVLGADDQLLELQPIINSIIQHKADVFVTNVQQKNIESGVTVPYKCFLPTAIDNFNFLSFPFHHQGFIFRLFDSKIQKFHPELGLHSDYEFMARMLHTSNRSVFVDTLLSEYSTGGASDYFALKNLKSLNNVASFLGLSRFKIIIISPLKFFRMLFKLVIPISGIDFLRKLFR